MLDGGVKFDSPRPHTTSYNVDFRKFGPPAIPEVDRSSFAGSIAPCNYKSFSIERPVYCTYILETLVSIREARISESGV